MAPQHRAWTRPDGLGSVSFDYFRVLCGVEATKPDVMVRRWLAGVLGSTPGVRAARELVAALTDELARRWHTDVSKRTVDHTIWRMASGRSLAR